MKVLSRFKNWDGKTFTTINITNVSHKEDAEPIKAVLDGKTFMNFEVGVAPVGGSFNVFVTTSYDASANEILGMVIGVLANNVKF